MSLIVNPGYALQFNGISDSVLVPIGDKNLHGTRNTERPLMPKALSSFTLESWIIPDCGGVVFEQENVMRLTVGSPGSPAPAAFEIRLRNAASGRDSVFTISSATPVSNANGTLAYWNGALFPNPSNVHHSYSGSDATLNDATGFNDGNRELLNVTVTFNRRALSMHINGDLVASKTFDEDFQVVPQSNHIYLGGRGGDYRGIIESIHWSRGEKNSGRQPYAPVKGDDTLALWRFEEPIEPVNIITTTPSLTASTSANSTITIGATAAQKLIDEFTGQSGLTALDFTASPWSAASSGSNQGSYKVSVYGAGTSSDVNIPKVPYNILINPLGYNPDTGKPSTKAPERLRLMAIDSSAGTITVESIHLDFSANPTNGRRGLLMNHDAGRMVIITGDCVVDGGNGNDFQPHGSGTQFSQRQGQVIIDEGPFGLHGMMFSLSMAIDANGYNPFSASTTNMGANFVIGHSGRHTLNHVKSHPFMGKLPPTAHHEVEKKLDASSDTITATFPSQFSDVKSVVPTNSIISSYDSHSPITVSHIHSSENVNIVVENGMAGIDDTQRDILALGGNEFNPEPFLLRSITSETTSDDARALIPSDESRIAILGLPALSDYGYAPFLQIHYNAVDRFGSQFDTVATARITSVTSTVVTLESVKAFGPDGHVLEAAHLMVDRVPAKDGTGSITGKISHSANTITFSAATDAAFQAKALVGTTLIRAHASPKILVEKTLPKVSTSLTGSTRIIDLLHSEMKSNPLTLHAPGGIIEFDMPNMFPFKEGHLEGDSSEGTVAENKLDFSLCPANYLPLHSTDKPQTTPQKIKVAQSELSSRSSKFHKLLISRNRNNLDNLETVATLTRQKYLDGQRRRIGLYINSISGYASGTQTALTVDGVDATTVFQVGDTVYKSDGTQLGILTAVTTTTLTLDTTISQISGGTGYTTATGVATTGGTGAGLTVDIVASGGVITSITVNAAGTGYTAGDIVTVNAGGTNAKFSIFSAGTTADVVDNDELYDVSITKGKGTPNQSTAVNEMLDIVEHIVTGDRVKLVVHPTDRRRFNQLSRMIAASESASEITVEYLMSQGRVLSFSDDGNGNSVLLAHGLLSDISSSSVYVKGDGASDSHIVKEIMPGAPVVTMTLGGPGQGAINTKETWDPSPTARLAWNTRRDGQAVIKETGATTLTVLPLNNRATDLQSWGTYPFASQGQVYLQLPKLSEDEPNRFASATYTSKDGTTFTFDGATGYMGTGTFVLGDGSESDSFADWKTATGIDKGSILHVDDKFGEETMCNDGTTINDRLFQTLDTVQHDYQLGTQYASTRALVEIPLFHEQIFGDFVGPDNAMKLHIDCTHTAHSWNPNPVGRRFDAVNPADPELFGPFSYAISNNDHRSGTKVTRDFDSSNLRIYVEDARIFPIPTAAPIAVAGIDGALRFRRAFLSTGEWCIYSARDTTAHYLTIAGAAGDTWSTSVNFLRDLKLGAHITPAPGYQDMNYTGIADNPQQISAGYEARRSFYYDRSNVMTQGGNVDYGLKQYVSAIEFRAGPRSNPHLARIKSKRPKAKIIGRTPAHPTTPVTTLIMDDASLFPEYAPEVGYHIRISWTDTAGTKHYAYYSSRGNNTLNILSPDAGFNPPVGDEILVEDFHTDPTAPIYPKIIDGFLNRAWAHPYAPGGLRNGDTVWMNMHYTNPHAIEGLFCKSRGTLNEAEVWTGFNGGQGSFNAAPRDSIPMENFLIGNTCIETAQNLVQHINKTVLMNYDALGLPLDTAPTVAYIDPYQSTEDFTRVLLYDVAHDREFIAFQDLWMQVQSSPAAASIGAKQTVTTGLIDNNDSASGSHLDVAAGFPSQSKSLQSTEQSDFIEASYVHNHIAVAQTAGGLSTHSVNVGKLIKNGQLPRTNNAVTDLSESSAMHADIEPSLREISTFFDTPDGTRCIPAFLAMKGIRSKSLDLSGHEESRLQHLDHWTQMDFVRRLTIDLGEVKLRDGVDDIQSAAIEVVRLINQAAAKNGRTHARRPADQFLGESEKFDLSSPGPKGSDYSGNTDPAASHQHADFATTGSTHDPAPFWDVEKAFASHDRGSHMGYVRAHIGRVVEGGYSIVIHSTVPGAGGRNFCLWMDNSRAQTPYQPEYLIGHGGRFRNYWCQPDEMTGENMHPAPMPINRFGRPFAPITTLKEFLPPEEVSDITKNNLSMGADEAGGSTVTSTANVEMLSGRNANTLVAESLETKSPSSTLIDGLRIGTPAKARINFGGLTQAGIPGWCPEAGKWGFGRDMQNDRYTTVYGKPSNIDQPMVGMSIKTGSSNGYIPDEDMKNENIGDSNLYGLRFVDHLGKSHTIRFIYRQFGQRFANDLTSLPPTLDDEILIHFDDRDVGQGGFTIGRHMVGVGEVCGQKTGGDEIKFKGNLWNNYPSPAVGVAAATTLASGTMTLVLDDPYDSGGHLSHPDVLGYLGFPESGTFQLSLHGTTANDHQGLTFSYTSRTHNDNTGPHKFFGVVGGANDFTDGDWYLSPRINFTSVLTDEVIAAAVEFAMKMGDVSPSDIDATSFDCREMFAPDGRTLGEWGVDAGAIRVIPRNETKLPLSKLFDVSRTKDWGLLDGASTDAIVVSKHTGGLSDSDKDNGTRLDIGYIPKTVLHITTKYRGTNANTATPVLVDTQNNLVDTTVWQRNLRGENFTDVAGDHIIPRVDSPMIEPSQIHADRLNLPVGENIFLLCKPACDDANSWGNPVTLWWGSQEYGKVRSNPNAAAGPERELNYDVDDGCSENFHNGILNHHEVFIRDGGSPRAKEICGIRRAGSKNSSPFLYFRGARDSPDHWVPLYFGGGFSGAVMDINDGTQNDYADFYTHPYSSGPTGSAGFQNVGELAGSYALVDTNAMLAMFPGTPYLDQHRGESNPPMFNQDGILPFDMAKETNTKSTGMVYTDGTNTIHPNMPSPVVLRFAHPHARYSATGETTDSTTYMIFGPGQAFPHNKSVTEPQGSNIVTTGNGYSAVPIYVGGVVGRDTFLPNQLANGNSAGHSGFNQLSSESAHLPLTTFFQRNNLRGFNHVMNWQPTKGFPNTKSSTAHNYSQLYNDAFYFEGSNHATAMNLPPQAHPFSFPFADVNGGAVASAAHPKTRMSSIVWHMDGGYHPGGHFLDNHVLKNPAGPSSDKLATGSGVQHNVSAFRPCGVLAQAYLAAFGGDPSAQATAFSENVVIVDATRVQNAEELGTILAASINTFPGKDPFKAIGGTFMPSMQNAHKQDRYGWVQFDYGGGTPHDPVGPTAATITVTGGPGLNNIPKYGWLRLSDGAATVGYSAYIDHNGVDTFTLAVNPIITTSDPVDPAGRAAIPLIPGPAPDLKVYIWSKAGVHRHNNSLAPGVRDHMCQVHFSGYVDAVDRTKPIGAVGWAGEAYSYLNSYETTETGPNNSPAGLGAWHPFLGFSPYGAAESCFAATPPQPTSEGTFVTNFADYCVNSMSSRHLVAITHESELPLIAKTDRDGIIAMGDYLLAKQQQDPASAGTITWDTNKIHNKSRYVGPATAGPHVEAQMHSLFNLPTEPDDYPVSGAAPTDAQWHRAIQSGDMVQATSCLHPTGDLFWDESVQKGSNNHESINAYLTECIGIKGEDDHLDINGASTEYPHPGLFGFYNRRTAARNFSAEHVVWKRMDGGGLTMPAVNARGLGMVPWVKRKDGVNYKTVGEKVLGNVRFSFETTNAAMFPIIQAQELGHPQLAEQHPLEVRNALMIPNEDQQFKSLQVVDDTGQEHRLEGGSPLGTVIMDFRHISDREVEGLAPALAGAGVHPNLKIRLPNPDEIPGNIIVRSGFDRIQAYQNETIGSGGLQHPAQPVQNVKDMFSNKSPGPRLWPTWEDNGWEHLSQDAVDISTAISKSRLNFPSSTNQGWEDHTDDAPLQTAYEPHDRSLFFHVTRMGISMTHRYDVDELSFSAYDEANNEIDVTTTPEAATWLDTSEQSGGRYFLRVYDPTTNKGVLASYTGTGTNKFTNVVVSPDFKSFISGKTGLKVVPSYYMPAGSTRFFAARRLRDHSEYSGASPDMKRIDWFDVFNTLPPTDGDMVIPSSPFNKITKPKMTPMPIPRMGHHYVTPTMALMPGHYAHPAYQRMYDLHHACRSANYGPSNESLKGILEGTRLTEETTADTHESLRDPFIWFSTPTATYGPSDVHGGAFTLMTETKVKYEGYGIAASVGVAGGTNSEGGHSLVLEAAASYTLNRHFPDPLEVGAYQIIIQPNVFKQQLKGFHLNHSDALKAPSEAGTKVAELTGQQVNTVIAIEEDAGTNGAYTLILAEAMMADVRGCEVIINEVILDIEPDAGSQFTNLPPLALYNPLGVQETSSPSFTRRSLPYRPGMFSSATPGYTINIPWWGILHKDGATSAAAQKWRHLEWHKPDNYYEFCRASYGSVGAQLTLAGYPTTFLDLYEPHKRIRSLNPTCVVISADSGAQTITVDNNDLFPVVPYYGEVLELEEGGVRYTATYANRTGTLAHATLGVSTTFSTVTADASFWGKISAGDVLRLSRPYDTHPADSVYEDSATSVATRTLPQLAHGTRDTNSLHTPDAFLCMWHPNLGRPFTWYSDDASRPFYDATGVADTPVDQKGYNHIPEHFETIHYQDFNYVASKGPFGLAMKWVVPPGGAGLTPSGTAHSAADIDADANLSHQGGTIGANKYNFAGFWPGGSHGGGAVSRLESYGNALIGWGSDTYGMDCETYQDSTGIATLALGPDKNRCFGYRMAVRQAYNRPRWSPYVRGWLEVANSNALLGYYHGPLIQHDSKTNGWDYVGADLGQADVDFDAMYVGVLERITQISSLLNQDQIGRQVRYSDGRRMTAPYGCAIRTLRNASTTKRLYPGDDAGKGVEELALAHRYYLVDWWGNTRGEDVRRFPVRGFGIRPSWDPEDAYADTNITHRPAAHDLFGGDGLDRYSGNLNDMNNGTPNMNIADWFNPASALRVGDRGDGRGCRWPTVFNESLLMAVSENHDATGLVLSHSTSEPSFGQGLVRPSNLVLQDGEIERGISDRIDLNDEEGLLKTTANVGEATETVNADNRGAEPVSRDDVRIGLDVDTLAELNDGESREYVVMSTEAASLHTDREVGQRTNMRGAYDIGSRTLKDLDMTDLDWSAQPKSAIMRHSNAHANWALVGTYVMEWSKHAGILDVKGWGKTGVATSSNPYQDANHDPIKQNINYDDSIIQFLYRPVQNLDYKHSQMFRAHSPVIGPQATSNFYGASAGGKYGLFVSDVPSARTGTPSLPPYAPVYSLDPTSSVTVPNSQGPKIQGVDVAGYDKTDIRSPVARMVMSENTLEHFRSDASRRTGIDDEGDYSVQPRHSQTLHPKGSDGDASYNTGDHSGE